MSDRIADLIVEAGCYINTNRTDEDPVTLPDGSKVPVYLSCRRLLAQPLQRASIEEALAENVRISFPHAEVVIGIATAGIAWGHAVASALDLPMAYVRGSQKGYGVGGLVEGYPTENSQAVVIDDVLFSGSSVRSAKQALLAEKGISVAGVASLATLNGGGVAEYRAAGYNATSLTNYEEIVASALRHEVISDEEADFMRAYYEKTGLAP